MKVSTAIHGLPEHAADEAGPQAVRQSAAPRSSLFSRLRILQIRSLASLLNFLATQRSARNFITRLRSNPIALGLLNASLGFRREFPSFAAAQASASRHIQAGHEHPDEIRYHTSISDVVRESDYPLLFHLAPLAPQLQNVFDLGGNVGNLFYAYQTQLPFSAALVWTIHDLPMKKPLAQKIAAERAESRIRFADSIAEASGSDVFIASGSLHYFEQPLPEMLGNLQRLPTHVFVNRTPFSMGRDLITVQDNRSYLVPCKLHSRASIVTGMQALGYELVSEWPVHERRLLVPTHPDLSARTYTGFYFRRK